MNMDVAALRVVAAGLDHPEGVAAGLDGCLYAGGEAGQVYRIDPDDGSVEQIADTGGSVLGVALDAEGAVYVCDAGRRAVLRIDGTTVEPWCERASGAPLVTPNWAAFTPDGSMLLSDSGTEALSACDGRLVRVPPGGGDGEALDLRPLHFPNGLAVGDDGTAYVLESFTPRLSRVAAEGLETIADLPGVVPDGVAITADGDFVIGCYYPFHLLFVPASGGVVELLLDDVTGLHIPMPTNLAFFGADRRSMAIAALGGTAVMALDVPFAGAPLHYP